MTIKDFMGKVIKYMPITELQNANLNTITQEALGVENYSRVNKLILIINFIISELANTYFPVYKLESVTTANGSYSMSLLTESVKAIKEVRDSNGNAIDFSIKDNAIVTKITQFVVKYSYIPESYSLTDDIDYLEDSNASERSLLYGTIAEYCLTEGKFEEAIVWHEKYVDSIKENYVETSEKVKNTFVKKREWL